MDIRKAFIGISLICFIVSVDCQFTLKYIGEKEFQIGDNATFICEISPGPESNDGILTSWAKRSADGTSIKIGEMESMNSTIYQSAPKELASRFSMSNANFAVGKVEATILNVGIADAGNYICSIDDKKSLFQKSSSFSFIVYKLPSVDIEILYPEIDLRPSQTDNEVEGPADKFVNATENDVENLDQSPPADSKIELARCHLEGCYPPPSKITFQALNGEQWEINDKDFKPTPRDDGLYDVSVSLSVQPTPRLNQQQFICRASITEERRTVTSPQSEAITVFYPTSGVEITIEPSNTVNEGDDVTIRCISDGNPAPQKFVYLPDGSANKLENGDFEFKASKQSAGTYYCTAVDRSKTTFTSEVSKLDINSLDSVYIEGPRVLNKGGSTLECVAIHVGPIEYRWYKDDNPDTPTSEQSRLTLNYQDETISGTYTCKVTGAGKTLSSDHVVTVEKPCEPEITKLVSASPITPGNSFVKVMCIAHGLPECKMELNSYNNIDPETTSNYAQLIVEDFPKQMELFKVSCSAENVLGKTTKNDTVNHEEACCLQPSTGGLSGGVVVLLIIILAFGFIGLPLICFLMKQNRPSSSKNEKRNEDEMERANLNTQ